MESKPFERRGAVDLITWIAKSILNSFSENRCLLSPLPVLFSETFLLASDVLTGFVNLDSEIYSSVYARLKLYPSQGWSRWNGNSYHFLQKSLHLNHTHTWKPLWRFSYSYFHVRAEDGLRQILKEPFIKSAHAGSKLSISDASSVSPWSFNPMIWFETAPDPWNDHTLYQD